MTPLEHATAMGRANLTHGQSTGIGRPGSPAYRSWSAMKRRTQSPKHPAWLRYGGRGITVCERWQRFENFLADMGPRPAGMTLDRIDNDGNYEPGNCRWADAREQGRQARTPRKLTAEDVAAIRASSESVRALGRRYGVASSGISRIRTGEAWAHVGSRP